MSFFSGFFLPLRAVGLIFSKPRLLLLSAIPVAIAALVLFFGLVEIRQLLELGLHSGLQRMGWDWSSGAMAWASAGITLLVLIAGSFVFSGLVSVIAIPFNDFLAEASEPWVGPGLTPAPQRDWRGTLRIFWIDLGKNVLALLLTLVAVSLSWIPALNIPAWLLLWLLLAFQFLSYPQTRRGMRTGEGIRFIGRHWLRCLGFGLCLALWLSLPLVAFTAIPAAVVGGTLLYAECLRAEAVR